MSWSSNEMVSLVADAIRETAWTHIIYSQGHEVEPTIYLTASHSAGPVIVGCMITP